MQTFEVFTVDGHTWEWRLRDAKRRVIAHSAEPFANRDDCVMMIELMKSSVPVAPVHTTIDTVGARPG